MGDLEDIRVAPVCCCCCFCFWFLFTCITLPLSFQTLDQGRYALELSWNTQKIGETVVTEPGMKFVGLGNMFVEYPSVFQTMYFAREIPRKCEGDQKEAELDASCPEVIRSPIFARTRDGLEMQVYVSFQWRLQPNSLHPLYDILGADLYKDEFVRFARAALVEGCAEYPADMYFTNRTTIKSTLIDRLQRNFDSPERGLSIEIKDVQLREVDLPDEFDGEIASTQEQMQEVEVAIAEREERKIAMEREILVAKEKVEEMVEEAKGVAEKIRLENNAYVTQLLNAQTRQAKANREILQEFAADAEPFDKLFEIMKVRALQEHAQSKLLVTV